MQDVGWQGSGGKRGVSMTENNGREKLLTLKQVAARFQVSPSTVSYWVKRRMIACVRMPSGVPKIRESVVEQHLQEQTQ